MQRKVSILGSHEVEINKRGPSSVSGPDCTTALMAKTTYFLHTAVPTTAVPTTAVPTTVVPTTVIPTPAIPTVRPN